MAATDRVVPLDELDDFEIAEGDPDVRGWAVLGSDGKRIGRVDNLLIDTAAMKVRYLDVDVERGLVDNEQRHVLIPIGYARLDEDAGNIVVGELASTDVVGLPAYTRGPLTREYEVDLRTTLDTAYTPSAGAAFYEHEHFDEDRFYGRGHEVAEGEARLTLSEEELAVGKRRVQAGGVTFTKRVELERVREQVPLMHEEVTVERRPAPADCGTEVRNVGDEIHVPIVEEEVIVQKRLVVKEVLVIKKREVVEEEVVEADLRREHVDITREGDIEVREERGRAP